MIEHNKAIVALVLGICSCASCFLGVGAIIGVALGIVGIVFSRKATKAGNEETINKAGFVLSVIGLCVSGVVFLATLFIFGALATMGLAL